MLNSLILLIVEQVVHACWRKLKAIFSPGGVHGGINYICDSSIDLAIT